MPLNWDLINVDTLRSLELDKVAETVAEKECTAIGDVVGHLIRDETRWSNAQLEALRFVGASMTMMLRADEPSEPYGAMFRMGNERSALPTDFPRDPLLALLGWATGLNDPELRARFLDVIWVQAKAFPAAQGAVRAYLESARRLEDWHAVVQRLERALRLAASLGKGGVELRDEALAEIEALVLRDRVDDPTFLTYHLVGLMLEFGHGDAKEWARRCSLAAERAEAGGDFWRARGHYDRAAECFAAGGDSEARAAALRSAAESLVKEAESAVQQPGRGATAAATILAQAMDAMRQAPGGKSRADELHLRLLQLQEDALAELKPISTGFDGTELVERAMTAVRGKSFREAVVAICGMARPPSVDRLRNQVHEQAKVAILGSLFQSDIVNSRGRIVAKAPPLVHGISDADDEGLRVRMFQCARHARSITVQAMLDPARREITATHNPSRRDVIDLIRHSPWVPPGHAESIARALVAGFHGDMLVASHMVAPQMEAMVRHVVERAGGFTSVFDSQGLQPEKSLNTLLETEEARKAFGNDGVFELQDLLVDALGTNFRNEVAHGLLEDGGLFSTDALYAWWLLLRYCVLTALLVEQRAAGPSVPDGAGA